LLFSTPTRSAIPAAGPDEAPLSIRPSSAAALFIDPHEEHRRDRRYLVNGGWDANGARDRQQGLLVLSKAARSAITARTRKWLSEIGKGFDGVVAKPLDQPYRPGERTMRKFKVWHTVDAVPAATTRTRQPERSTACFSAYTATTACFTSSAIHASAMTPPKLRNCSRR